MPNIFVLMAADDENGEKIDRAKKFCMWSLVFLSVRFATELYFDHNCGNNKMLESDWFLTALIFA